MSVIEAVIVGSGLLNGIIIGVTVKITLLIKDKFFGLREKKQKCVWSAQKKWLIVTVSFEHPKQKPLFGKTKYLCIVIWWLCRDKKVRQYFVSKNRLLIYILSLFLVLLDYMFFFFFSAIFDLSGINALRSFIKQHIFLNAETGLEVIQLEFILRLKIKRNDWLLGDMCPQPANHCALF